MAMVVKSNMSAVRTLSTLNANSTALQKSLQKVSSGLKINSAMDDASGYAIAERMRVRIRSLDQANQNTQNGSSLMKTAEGALANTIEILKTLKEKAINAATDTNTDEDRATVQKEVDQMIDQIDDNALVTFNGKYVLEGSKSQHGIVTRTAMTNQSLDVDTVGTDKIISLRNRKGESLEINSTDTLTASYVKDGRTYTTSYIVNNTTLEDVFKNLNELAGGEVFGKSNIISQADSTKDVYSDGAVATSTIRSATTNELRKSFNAHPKADFELELAARDAAGSSVSTVNANIGYNSDTGEFSTDDSGTAYGALYAAISTQLATAASNSGVANTTENQYYSTGWIEINHTDGTVEKIALKNGTDENLTESSASVVNATQAIMDYIDEKVKEFLAHGTEADDIRFTNTGFEVSASADSTSSLIAEWMSQITFNSGGVQGASEANLALDESTETSATETANSTFSETLATDTGNAFNTYARAKVEHIYVSALNSLAMANDDVGLVPGDSVTKTVNSEKGITITASGDGLAGQISGLTINITDSSGQNRKSVNEFLDAFKTTIFAANASDDNSLKIHVGAQASQSISVGIADMRSEALGLKGPDGSTISLATREAANAAISVFENALQKALDQQTTIGAIESRLEYTASNLTTSSENVQAAQSVISDADMAKEMTDYTKNNVLLQAAQSMLAQANQNSSAVLSLLQ